MPSTQPLPPKKEVALALLERSSIYVHLDPRQPAVVVPVGFKKQPQLVLQVGLNMPVPIPDLHLDDDGISCTLSFNREAFLCVMPWASIFAIVGEDGRGMVWPDDVPAEVARQAQVRAVDSAPRKEPAKPVAAARDAKPGAPKKRSRKRAPLSAVPDAARSQRTGDEAKAVKPARAERPASQINVPRPVAAPAPTPRPVPGAARKKRQLPPYLRVVK